CPSTRAVQGTPRSHPCPCVPLQSLLVLLGQCRADTFEVLQSVDRRRTGGGGLRIIGTEADHRLVTVGSGHVADALAGFERAAGRLGVVGLDPVAGTAEELLDAARGGHPALTQ